MKTTYLQTRCVTHNEVRCGACEVCAESRGCLRSPRRADRAVTVRCTCRGRSWCLVVVPAVVRA